MDEMRSRSPTPALSADEDAVPVPPPPAPVPLAAPRPASSRQEQPPVPPVAPSRQANAGRDDEQPRRATHMNNVFTAVRAQEQQDEAERRAREQAQQAARERVDRAIYVHVWSQDGAAPYKSIVSDGFDPYPFLPLNETPAMCRPPAPVCTPWMTSRKEPPGSAHAAVVALHGADVDNDRACASRTAAPSSTPGNARVSPDVALQSSRVVALHGADVDNDRACGIRARGLESSRCTARTSTKTDCAGVPSRMPQEHTHRSVPGAVPRPWVWPSSRAVAPLSTPGVARAARLVALHHADSDDDRAGGVSAQEHAPRAVPRRVLRAELLFEHQVWQVDVAVDEGIAAALACEELADLMSPLTSLAPTPQLSAAPTTLSTADILRQVTELLQQDAQPSPPSPSLPPSHTPSTPLVSSIPSASTINAGPSPPASPPSKKVKISRRKSERGRAGHHARNTAKRTAKRDKARQDREEKKKAAGQVFTPAMEYHVRPSLSRKFLSALVEPIDAVGEGLPACEGAWKGLHVPEKKHLPTLKEALARGLRLQPWDGSKTIILVDKARRILGVLLSKPADGAGRVPLEETLAAAERAMDRLNDELEWGSNEVLPKFPKSEGLNRRGSYKAMSDGPSFGGGQKKPRNLTHTERNLEAIARFNTDPAVQRMQSIANGGFAFYAPKLYQYYVNTLARLYKHDPTLVPPFDGAIWANRTVSTTKKCTSVMHRDHNNLAFGWCAIQPVGQFDPKAGGHLILEEFGIVVEFPVGTTILLPSAVVTHGNTCIQEHETRKSLVSYSSGGLFRWVQYGFRSWKTFEKEEPDEAALEWAKRKEERPQFALSLFSTLDSLMDDHALVFAH
ncbi:hypothetical protein PsYK624_013450 [Phanerochaete sordida]|uniref:Uncharacterized protein n=1 Tax=Phanerochaete sordida TaxID=48140 RepID=A0A9P3FZ43_9APHY|nr:hypothetical protein PsYK624_013450 [Phanerochaete sordida]